MTDSTLLILGGGVLASVLAALIFTPRKVGEDPQTREMRKLMTALEAQRRIRDAQQARELRQLGAVGRPPTMSVQAPDRVAAAPPAPKLAPAPAPKADVGNDQRSAEQERKAALAAEQAERRSAEQQRKREEKERAAARRAELAAERQARRQAEQERKAALAAEQAERRAAEQQRKREEKERAAARKAELDAATQAQRQPEHEHTAAPVAEHQWPDLREPGVPTEATLDAEAAGALPAEEPVRPEIAGRPLTASAQRDLDEIARWREEDDRKAAAKAVRSKRRVSERVYKRREDAVTVEREAEEHARRAAEERRAELEAEEARRAAERRRAKEELERAAALESQRQADAEALRRAEEERNKALEAERTERIAAERQRAQEAEETPRPWTADPDHMAALNAERHALEVKRQELRIADEKEAHQRPDTADERSDEKPSRLADLPLYSWANANEDEDEDPAELD